MEEPREEWAQLTPPCNGKEGYVIEVSNPAFDLPEGLSFRPGFVDENDQNKISAELRKIPFNREGFDQQRRVQRYRFGSDRDGHEVPLCLVELRCKICDETGFLATDVSVEEYSVLKANRSMSFFTNRISTTFESTEVAEEGFVAQIPLNGSAIQHVNKPLRRVVNCWDLVSKEHVSDIRMEAGSLLLKTRDFLWNWRKHVAAECRETVLVLKFCSLPEEKVVDAIDGFGYVPSEADKVPRPPFSSLSEVLTVIITTSPVRSNPSTELLQRTMETFLLCGVDFAYKCRKVIVCDGFRVDEKDNKVKKYSNTKQAMRNGIVDSQQAENYVMFKKNLRSLCENATPSDVFSNTEVEELDSRHGYGFALRHALRYCVRTQFVCVIQHDRTFMRHTPMEEAVRAMWNHRHIKYIGMSMRSNLSYRDLFLDKYGRSYERDLMASVQRPPELLLSENDYGPNSDSTQKMEFSSEKLRMNIENLARAYQGSTQNLSEVAYRKQNPSPDGLHQLTLTPTLFWYDNVHICETKHYRDFVFDDYYKMVVRGGFVEDKLSPVIKRTVERLGFQGHARFGCYLLDDHSGMFFTGYATFTVLSLGLPFVLTFSS